MLFPTVRFIGSNALRLRGKQAAGLTLAAPRWRPSPGPARIQVHVSWGNSVMRAIRSALQLRRLVALGVCLMTGVVWAQSLAIIELQYRTADQVIPILQPLVEPGGALSGAEYQLFVRASSANVTQLRQALAQIDRQPRQLRVSVRRAARQTIEREGASASVVLGDPLSGATLHATEATSRRDGSGITSVQVLEGNAAYVAAGESVPVVTAVVAGSGRRPWVAASTSYRNSSSGFLVTPRVSGQRVVLDISQQSEQRGTRSGGIETQQLVTQVSGQLGEWVQLGGIAESSSQQRSGVLNRQYSTHGDDQEIWVKVEEGR